MATDQSKRPAAAPFTVGDVQAVQMAVLAQLVAALDASGALNGEEFIALLGQFGRQLPPGQQAASDFFLDRAHRALVTSRAQTHAPKPGSH